ncbi:hypothetical protein Cni_G03698 [Canna indica]|uniref:FLZ-type domain-containing protein n=1 Tax=Canna indica TaxID=4628 RepID=A0AAQ3JT04_9LILI|nr:hypothetical protein Cni_G03698 [Canna indica]
MPCSANQQRSSFAKLALFFGFGDSSAAVTFPIAARSSHSFAADGSAIGLGIVAEMGAGVTDAAGHPVVVGFARTGAAAKAEKRRVPPVEEMELSESYTCVIAYHRGHPVKRGIYYGDGDDGIVIELRGKEVVLFELSTPPPPLEVVVPPFQVGEVLRRCFRCKKELDGLDIYMFRGEKAFCSPECRCQHIVLNEQNENGVKENHQHPLTPSPAPPLLAAEIVRG